MKINFYSLGFLTGTTAILWTNPSSLAATNQIEDIVLSPQTQGLELRLTTNDNDTQSPSFVTIVEDNEVTTTILNTKLRLSSPVDFRQTNPTQGIDKISINEIDEDNTQIILNSTSNMTFEPTLRKQGEDLIFELNSIPQSQSLLSRIPLLSNISDFKPKLPSFLISQAVEDDLMTFADRYNGHDNLTSILIRIKLKPDL